ncbi:type VI secretion system secreted protein VgrG [Pseudomonas duriflava]|uniref:Type VI secretion system secreted protein VgrG n=1 Tax=Pseudomonas duriflava TaxID=459528 RepID=A0A562QJ70_9PSED|nr:type VI secretion system secreted protein VgrG [Pseudomonas duriflava]
MLDANTSPITLFVEGDSNDFQVLSFEGYEALNQTYRFDIELVSERPSLDLGSLLHKPAYFAFGPAGCGVHGLVYRAEQGDSGKRLTRYRLSLVPQLAYLAHRTNQRIFQQLSVTKIIESIFKEHGLFEGAYRFQLGKTVYPPRDYCVQYDESDLHFIQRLCEEEGLSYHFQHSGSGHVLVFGDDQTVFPTLSSVPYQQDSGMAAQHEVVRRFGVCLATRTSRVTRRDYNFEKPRLLMEAAYKGTSSPDLEDYDYPGRFTDRTYGKLLAQRALERHQADSQLAEGNSDAGLVSGHFLPLTHHPRTSWNALWLVQEVFHEGRQPQVLEESVTSDTLPENGFTQGYRNRFTATPWDVPYRPALKHPKPKVLGSH